MSLIRTYALLLAVIIPNIHGQAPSPPELQRLIKELGDTIRADDLAKATDLAAKLEDGLHRQYWASLNSDAQQRIDEVLSWLPADAETLFVLQQPLVISAGDSAATLADRPAQFYAVDRLLAQNEGRFYKQLAGHTIRLVVAAMKDMRSRARGVVPALMPDADVAYFYFFAEPVEPDVFGTHDGVLETRPAWRGMKKTDAGEPLSRGGQRAQREDETWLALAGPDLLIVASRREFLTELVGRIVLKTHAGAFPKTLPEWAQVDRQASFWGLRHFADPESQQDFSNPRNPTGMQPDPSAVGVTVRFDIDRDALDVRYLSAAKTLPVSSGGIANRAFETELVEPGVWRLRSSTRDRGPFPFHFALSLLGFGGYH